ncbi:MAG TPA: hypothetical protein VKV73_19710 [Chloroflexota bacterium]|nr:hypothetical protein [Chloroflexota bacterium]
MLLSGGVRYGERSMGALRWLPSLVLLLPWLLGPIAPSNDARIRDLAGPAGFRLLDWEMAHVGERAGRLWAGLVGSDDATAADTDALGTYFRAGPRRADLRPQAEAALERLVASAYRAGGLTRSEPFFGLDRLFPPVLVALTPPPNVLVIAPRTALRVVGSSVLQAMDVPAQERLEASADSTDVSSLVAPIGGLATYPSMVLEDSAPEQVLAAVAHEWLHQYLVFYPLGQAYWNSQETREINETTAELVGVEVGGQLAATLGLTSPGAGTPPPVPTQPAFDFRVFMRETRAQTETLLGDGQVAAAEDYMRARRDELRQHGYQIRKLNQAYFALYGSYGDGYAASPSNPIPGLLRTLRARSATLAEFIFQVREITTVAELTQAAS